MHFTLPHSYITTQMKNIINVFAAIVFLAGAAYAQNSASTNGTATAHIIRPITIKADRDLAFGNIVSPNATATVTITSANPGVVTYSDPGTKPGTQVGTQNSAKFIVTGEPGFTFDVTQPTTSIFLSNGAATPTFLLLVLAAGSQGSNPVADVTGTVSFYVGGTLTIPTNKLAGTYSNAFSGGTAWLETVAYH